MCFDSYARDSYLLSAWVICLRDNSQIIYTGTSISPHMRWTWISAASMRLQKLYIELLKEVDLVWYKESRFLRASNQPKWQKAICLVAQGKEKVKFPLADGGQKREMRIVLKIAKECFVTIFLPTPKIPFSNWNEQPLQSLSRGTSNLRTAWKPLPRLLSCTRI